jgi:hypothetical protein
MAIHIPGFGGYLDRGNRRAADRALRDAVAQRLGVARARVQRLIQATLTRAPVPPSTALGGLQHMGTHPESVGDVLEAQKRYALSEVSALERLDRHIDRVAERLRAAGSGTDAFYHAENLKPAEADALHAFDLALLDRAQALLERFDAPDLKHDFLADLEDDLNQFEKKLDERAMLLQGIR